MMMTVASITHSHTGIGVYNLVPPNNNIHSSHQRCVFDPITKRRWMYLVGTHPLGLGPQNHQSGGDSVGIVVLGGLALKEFLPLPFCLFPRHTHTVLSCRHTVYSWPGHIGATLSIEDVNSLPFPALGILH